MSGDRQETTVLAYIVVFETFQRKYPEATKDQAVEYIQTLIAKKRQATYINRFIDVIHMYGQYLKDPDYKEIGWLKEKKPFKSTLTDEEITAFLELPPTTISRTYSSGKVVTRYQHEKLYRMMTIFWKICAFTGCRMGEASHLTKQDIFYADNAIRFNGKTGDRIVPLPSNVKTEILEYINNCPTDSLFPSARGGNSRGHGEFIDAQDWGHSFRNRIKRLGIQRKGLTSYSMRHSFVSSTLDGKNVFDAMSLYGHKDPKTTLGYYHTSLDNLRKVMSKHKLIQMHTNPREVFADILEALKSFRLDTDGRFTYSLKEENKKLMFELEITDEDH